LGDKTKGAATLSKGFVEEKGTKLPYFEGKKKVEVAIFRV